MSICCLIISCGKDGGPVKPPPPPVTGSIAVKSLPSDAAIKLDGAATGHLTPGTITGVPVGTHTVGLALPNYADTAVSVLVLASQETQVDVNLRHSSSYDPPSFGFNSRTTALSGALSWMAAGDFTGDGKSDLVVAAAQGSSNRILLLPGTGDGLFGVTQTVIDTSAGLWGMTSGDFDHDGKADVAGLFSSGYAKILLFLGNGDGTFRRGGIAAFPYSPSDVSVGPLQAGDVNGDGSDDLLVGYRSASNGIALGVYLATGSGSLQAIAEHLQTFAYTTSSPTDIAVADLTGDGIADVAQGLYGFDGLPGGVVLWRGLGGGAVQFPPAFVSSGGYAQEIAIGDVNRDGRADLIAANTGGDQAQGTAAVLLGRGDGTFQAPLQFRGGLYSVAVALRDFNGDQRPDLVLLDSFGSTVSALAGYGDGAFEQATAIPTAGGGYRLAIADFNGDSRPDLAVTFVQGAAGALVQVLLAR